MSGIDLSQFLTGGAAGRPDSVTGLDPRMQNALAALFLAAPEDIRGGLRIGSGFRSNELQEQLFRAAVQRHGSEEAARRWVAPPGRSQHNHGRAVDLSYASDAAREWAHANAAAHGLAFPLAHENWHIELADARGMPAHDHQGGPQAPAQGQVAPMQGNALAALDRPVAQPQGGPQGRQNALAMLDPDMFMNRRRFDAAPVDYLQFLPRG